MELYNTDNVYSNGKSFDPRETKITRHFLNKIECLLRYTLVYVTCVENK